MTEPNENQPLGQSISEIVDRTTKIVHEEIELAKAEIAVSLQNLLRGSVAGIVGGVFAFFGLFILLIGISLLISDLIDFGLWPGFLIVALLLFAFGGLLALVALKKIKKGSQLVPAQAIAEAKETQSALKKEMEQQIDSTAVEETTTPVAAEVSAGKPDTAAEPADADKTAEAADLLAAAKDVVDAPPVDPPAPKFVTDKADLPNGGEPEKKLTKEEKAEAKAREKAEKAAAKEREKAEKAAAKERANAEKQAAKEMKAAEKEAAKARKEADKAIKKAGGEAQAETPAPDVQPEAGDEPSPPEQGSEN